MAPGVIQIVGNGKVPLPVANCEIERLQVAVASEVARQPWPYINVGERVRVNHGSLRGVEGILTSMKGSHRVILSVSLLQRSVAVEVDLSWLTAIEKETRHLAVQESVSVPVTSY